MRRIEVIEGPLRGEPPKKIVDALVMDEQAFEDVKRMRTALELIRDGAANPADLAYWALKSPPMTAYAWDALRDRNGA